MKFLVMWELSIVQKETVLAVMQMPDYARKIREQPWGKNMVLIALTGWGQQQDRQRTQDAGFDAHLTKPVNFSAIMELLARLPAPSAGVVSENPSL